MNYWRVMRVALFRDIFFLVAILLTKVGSSQLSIWRRKMGLWWVSSPIFASSDAQKGTLLLSSPLWWAVITPFSLIEISVMTRNSLENLVRWKRLHFHAKSRFVIMYWFSDTYKSVRFLRKIRAKTAFVKKNRFLGPENCHFMRQNGLTPLPPLQRRGE